MDIAILNSRVYTGDPAKPWAEAVYVKDGKVAAVGTSAEIGALCGAHTQRFELPGRLVTPGLVDAHLHFVSFGFYLERVDLRDLTSIAACRERVKAAIATKRPGEWIIGRGWNEHIWTDRREPCAKDLDDIAPDHPVMLTRCCGHSVWLNSLAMKTAGITKAAVDAPGARIERDGNGNPVGLCREYRKIIEKMMAPPTLEQRKAAGLRAQAEALRNGVTGVHSCETLLEWEALSALEAEGKLKVRIHHTLPPDQVETAKGRGIELTKGSDRLWFGQVKLYADGSLGSSTALMHAPYSDNPGTTGLVVLTVPQMQERIELAYRHGGDVAVHAIGDLATSNVLDAIEGARKTHPGPWRRGSGRGDVQHRVGLPERVGHAFARFGVGHPLAVHHQAVFVGAGGQGRLLPPVTATEGMQGFAFRLPVIERSRNTNGGSRRVRELKANTKKSGVILVAFGRKRINLSG